MVCSTSPYAESLFWARANELVAMCSGPNAESGECKLSVVQQLSTMPSWMYKGGYCQDASPSCLPLDPWDTTDPFNAYASGRGEFASGL